MYQNENKPMVFNCQCENFAITTFNFLKTMTIGHSGYSSLKPKKCGNDKLTGMNTSPG